MSAFLGSPLDRLLDELKRQASVISRVGEALEAPLAEAVRGVEAELAQVSAGVTKRWAPAFAVVSSELPKRGWYLTGQEPITLIGELASRIKDGDWQSVDQLLISYVFQLRLDKGRLRAWLVQEGVPPYTIERTCLVVDACESRNYEVATIAGMATVDELCRHLYDMRDFTSKRGRRSVKPQMALATPSSRRRITAFAVQFVQAFGVIHEDVDPSRLEDEDYFNRSAILHGLMRRHYGPLDSAKVLMLLMFLVFGAEPLSEA